MDNLVVEKPRQFKTIQRYLWALIFLSVMVVGFWLRLVRFQENYLIGDGDVGRDFRIAHEIAVDHKLPRLGPVNSQFSDLYNSPFYYYFLSLFLYIKDDPYTLGYINVALQAVSIISLCYLALSLFGKNVALLSCILLVLNQKFIDHSFFMWQPWAAQPFYYASIACLARAYVYKKSISLFISVWLFLWGLGMGLHGFPALPLYMSIVIVCVLRLKMSATTIILLCLSSILIFASLYSPVIVLFIDHHGKDVLNNSVYVSSFSEYISKLVINTRVFIDGMLYTSKRLSVWDHVAKLYLFVVMLVYIGRKTAKRNYYGAPFVLLICSLLLFASLLQKRTYEHYFVVGTGPTIVFFSEIALSTFSSSLMGLLGKVCAILALVSLTTGLGYLRWITSDLDNRPPIIYVSQAILDESKFRCFDSISGCTNYTIGVMAVDTNGAIEVGSTFAYYMKKINPDMKGRVIALNPNNGREVSKASVQFAVCVFDNRTKVNDQTCQAWFAKFYPKASLTKKLLEEGEYDVYAAAQKGAAETL